MLRFIVSLASILCSAAALLADPVSVTLSAATLDKAIRDLKFTSGAELQTMSIFKRQRSRAFTYRGTQAITFYRESAELDTDGKPIRIIVAKAHIPSESGQYLLLFATKTTTPEVYEVLVIPDDWKVFKPGTCRFLNLAPFEIALKINEKLYRIKAQNYTDVQGDFRDGSHQEAMMISLPDDTKPRRIFDGFIYFTERQRTIYVIIPKSGRTDGSVNFLSIPQAASTESGVTW